MTTFLVKNTRETSFKDVHNQTEFLVPPHRTTVTDICVTSIQSTSAQGIIAPMCDM